MKVYVFVEHPLSHRKMDKVLGVFSSKEEIDKTFPEWERKYICTYEILEFEVDRKKY